MNYKRSNFGCSNKNIDCFRDGNTFEGMTGFFSFLYISYSKYWITSDGCANLLGKRVPTSMYICTSNIKNWRGSYRWKRSEREVTSGPPLLMWFFFLFYFFRTFSRCFEYLVYGKAILKVFSLKIGGTQIVYWSFSEW